MRAISAKMRTPLDFLRPPNGGLVVTASSFSLAQRDVLVQIATRHRLPAVYPFDYFVRGGGLISYGPTASISIGKQPPMSIVF